jgi:hypothetical protein
LLFDCHPERSEGPAVDFDFDFDFCFSIVILSGAKDLLSILPLILLLLFDCHPERSEGPAVDFDFDFAFDFPCHPERSEGPAVDFDFDFDFDFRCHPERGRAPARFGIRGPRQAFRLLGWSSAGNPSRRTPFDTTNLSPLVVRFSRDAASTAEDFCSVAPMFC